jgi:K+-transporting ATPase KdpF subunit
LQTARPTRRWTGILHAAARVDAVLRGVIAMARPMLSLLAAAMSLEHLLGLLVAVLLTAYLVYALLAPERF